MTRLSKAKNRENYRYSGLSLVEILIVVGILGTIIGVMSFFSIDTMRFHQNSRNKTLAAVKIEELTRALETVKGSNWSQLYSSLDDGAMHLQFSGNQYSIVAGASTDDNMNLSFSTERVYRDASRNIVSSGGTEDIHTLKLNVQVTWNDFLGASQNLNTTMYVNNWEIQKFDDTTEANFDAGTLSDTYVENDEGGEIWLGTVFYPDWCNPSLSINQYDIPGSATATTVFARPGYAYLGTAGSSSGISVTKLSINGVDPPVVAVDHEYDNYLVNNIFVLGNYAYLATTDDNKEVVILDISVTPFVEVGHYNGSGTNNGYSVWVDGRGVGYLAQGRKVDTFDVGYTAGNPGTAAANTGARTSLDELNLVWLFGTVSQVIVIGDYLYASLNNDWYELGIVNVAAPNNISVTSQTTVNNQQVQDIYMSADGSRAYFGTNSSSSEREFFILDTTTKTGSRPIVGSYDTNGMSVRGLALLEEDDRVVLVGTSAEEYQGLDISNENSPTKCGGMQINNGIYDIDTVVDGDGNAFSYLMTGDTTSEFKILRGGPGGGGANGYGYVPEGYFTSRVFDTTSATPTYYNFAWNGDLPTNTNVQVQLRSGDTANLSGQPWRGPDGTASTYFTGFTTNTLPSQLQNHRYIQYRLRLTSGDIAESPVFKDISLFYSE
ncbi:MAG: hypothetical protein QY318_03220 [Candidatus Dojkabacteria bacterium]|nr:MAG: hypothetical protein QY318_03220 [Candidatus Dojkabacteria bacterium]